MKRPYQAKYLTVEEYKAAKKLYDVHRAEVFSQINIMIDELDLWDLMDETYRNDFGWVKRD